MSNLINISWPTKTASLSRHNDASLYILCDQIVFQINTIQFPFQLLVDARISIYLKYISCFFFFQKEALSYIPLHLSLTMLFQKISFLYICKCIISTSYKWITHDRVSSTDQ